MPISLGVVMDPIQTIKTRKDSSFAMLLEAQKRGWDTWYMEQADIFLRDNRPWARMRSLKVTDNSTQWFDFVEEKTTQLDKLQILLMRKDPPFDMEYIYTTYLLEQAESRGSLVVNRPASLRDANEKLYTAWFPECCPPTLVSRRAEDFLSFLAEHGDIIMKPLGGMGGNKIFRLRAGDPNINVVIETLTEHATIFTMAQRFIPEISEGDKRILLIDGQAIPYALARVPKEGETRGNLAAGATGHGVELSERDQWIVQQVGPKLRQQGILFAGLDVIGDYLTEINVTSPTGIRELDAMYNLNISGVLLDSLESKLAV